MDREFFEQVEDAVHSLMDGAFPDARTRSHRSGVKLWLGEEKPGRLHYEAQLLKREFVDGATGVALEVGFHAEQRDEAQNQAVVERLILSEAQWRPVLGAEATCGVFYGAQAWRRLSDVWLDADFDDEDAVFEVASRLFDYVSSLEPILRGV